MVNLFLELRYAVNPRGFFFAKTQKRGIFMNTKTLQDKIGQLFVVGFQGKVIDDAVRTLIHDYRVGNFILFSRNIGTPEEVLALTSDLQAEAKKAGHEKPLLICLDQENGIVRRLKDPTTQFPGPMSLGAISEPELAKQIGLATASELRQLGINWNLAPVVDINNNPKNPVINVRSFGASPNLVAQLATEWFKGQQEGGVASTLKHFPGHGDTDVDSHLDLPVINHSMERLFDIELLPFIEGINQGADVIMSAHIYFSALEKEFGRPATLSHSVLTGLLREQLGFRGIITTDCLEMNAILNTVGVGKGSTQAISAGADLVMISHTLDLQIQGIEAVRTAVENGGISEEQINLSYERVIALKNKYAQNWNDDHDTITGQSLNFQEHQELAKEAYQKSVCEVNKVQEAFSATNKSILIYQENSSFNQAEGQQEESKLKKVLDSYSLPIAQYALKEKESLEDLLEHVNQFHQKIVLTYSLTKEDSNYNLIKSLVNEPNTLLISLRGPYPVYEFEGNPPSLCVFDDSKEAVHAVLDVCFGIRKATGKLPV